MIYTVTLNPSIDYSLYMKCFLKGEINRSENEVVSFGGKGLNVSAMLRNLGVGSTALGFCGGFTGKEIERLVKKHGIKCDFTEIRDMSRINVKILDDNESAINGKGPFIRLEEEEELIGKLASLSEEYTVIISGKSVESESGKLLERVLSASSHTRLVIDMAGDDLSLALRYKPFLIKPNREELSALFEKNTMSEEELCQSARELLSRGVGNILLSLGGDGAMLFTGEGKAYRARAPRIEVVNTVGAGDSLLAGFLAGEERGVELALALAVAAGSATAASSGIADGTSVMEIFSEM